MSFCQKLQQIESPGRLSSSVTSTDDALVDNSVVSKREGHGLSLCLSKVDVHCSAPYKAAAFKKKKKNQQLYHVSCTVTGETAVKTQTGSFWFWFCQRHNWKARGLMQHPRSPGRWPHLSCPPLPRRRRGRTKSLFRKLFIYSPSVISVRCFSKKGSYILHNSFKYWISFCKQRKRF